MHFRVLCLLTLIRIFPTEASVYYEYPNQATWTEAKNSCSLALPEFWNDLGQKVVNVTNNITTDLWVGYFKAQTGFEYKGCIRNEIFTPQMDSERITIGQCYSACGRKQMIGISGRRCYCEDQFNFNEGIRSTFCYKCNGCPANVSNTCEENDCLSVYKVNQNVTKDQRLYIYDNMCLKFAGEEIELHKRYTWTDCKLQYLAFCEYEYGAYLFQRGENWRESANVCFSTKGYPLTYAKLQAINESTETPVWTSIISSNVIYTYAEYDNSLSNIRFGYLSSKGSRTVLKFKAATTQRALCRNVSTESPVTSTIVSTPGRHVSTDNDLSTNTEEASTSSVAETENATSTDVSTYPGYKELNEEEDADSLDLDVGAIIGSSFGCVLVITAAAVILVTYKRRRTNQGIRQTDVGKVPEQSNNITLISDEARDGAYTIIQDNATRGASEEIEMQNPQKIVYESLGERNDEEHGYGTANTHRSAYESLGDRHHEEHGYGTPNAQRSTYESLGERHNEEHSFGVSAKGTSGFYQSLEEERIDTHNYEIAGQPREIAFDSPGDKIKDTHCDGTSSQKDNIKLYEWVE